MHDCILTYGKLELIVFRDHRSAAALLITRHQDNLTGSCRSANVHYFHQPVPETTT